ncbi:MAG: hypothetical protein JWQ98_2880 [Chlorobi bacterium]|nr:hypothetical protein [Chlorobiota bacterium]
MTQSEAILEYIDGTLGHDAEQHLFESMARQPDLRSTLRQFISIGQAVHADREAYAPPAYVEHALLSGLGIPPIASAVATGAAGAGLMARLGLSGWRIWGMVGSFILGALLAGGTVYMANGTSRATVIAGNTQGSNGPANGNGTIAGTAPHGAMSPNGNPTVNGTMPSNGNPAANGTSGSVAGTPLMAQGGSAGSATANASGAGNALATGNASVSANASGTPIARNPASHATVSRSTIARNDAGLNAGRFQSRTTSMIGRSGSNGASGANGNGGSRMANTTRNGGDNGGTSSSAAASSTSNSGGADKSQTASAAVPQEGSASAPKMALITPVTPRGVPMTIADTSAAAFSRAPEQLPASSLSPLDAGDGDPARVIGELRGMAGSSLNKTNALNNGSGLARALEYFAVGAYWQLGTHFAVGAEGGLEPYDQVLHFSNGDTAKVEQRPSYAWGGLAARYNFGTITAIGVEPFAQWTIGATSAGPLGRFRVGGRHDFSGGNNDFSMTGGIETSGLIYTSNGNPAISGRWGATIGLEMKLW